MNEQAQEMRKMDFGSGQRVGPTFEYQAINPTA